MPLRKVVSRSSRKKCSLRIDIITIFPEMFPPVINASILKRAQAKGRLRVFVHNLRDFSRDKHRKVDDRPFGGGPGMVMRSEPLFGAVRFIKSRSRGIQPSATVLLSPQGARLDQGLLEKLLAFRQLILICGHYEGVDERVRRFLVDREISIGDYVLTGGELPAMVLIDSLVRLLPGVLGNEGSISQESFSQGLLEYPHYTRPASFEGMKVPEVLLSGDHAKIEAWRKKEALRRTRLSRPDLLEKK